VLAVLLAAVVLLDVVAALVFTADATALVVFAAAATVLVVSVAVAWAPKATQPPNAPTTAAVATEAFRLAANCWRRAFSFGFIGLLLFIRVASCPARCFLFRWRYNTNSFFRDY
jgi:hypothetical protein